MKKFAIAVLAAATAFSGIGEAFAAPFAPVVRPTISSEVEHVQYRRRPPANRPGWHRGYRGYRYARPGYRRYNDGWWYPLAAFTAGAIIGGAVGRSRPAAGLPARHVQWCSARYRTYRVSDNTYVPRVGVRAICRSPYY